MLKKQTCVYLTVYYQYNVIIFSCVRDLKGPEVPTFDLKYPKIEKYFENETWGRDAQNKDFNNKQPIFFVKQLL